MLTIFCYDSRFFCWMLFNPRFNFSNTRQGSILTVLGLLPWKKKKQFSNSNIKLAILIIFMEMLFWTEHIHPTLEQAYHFQKWTTNCKILQFGRERLQIYQIYWRKFCQISRYWRTIKTIFCSHAKWYGTRWKCLITICFLTI